MFSNADHVGRDHRAPSSPWLLAGLLLAACGGGGTTGSSDPTTVTDSFAAVQTIFDNHCIGCHGGAAPNAAMSLEAGQSYANIVGVATRVFCPGGTRVVPGDPASSCLYQLVASGQMPATGALAAVLKDTIRAWIAAGARDAAGQAPASGPFALTLASAAFAPHNTQTVYAAVVRTGDGMVVAGPELRVVQSGAFSFSFGTVLDPGQSYSVEYFADLDASASCTAADHKWSVPVGAASADVTLSVTHDAAQTDVCDTFAALATPATAADVLEVFAGHCTRCHGGATASAGMDLSADHAEADIIGVATQVLCQPGGTRVVAGKPDDSCLWRMVGTDVMPASGAKLGAGDKQKIRSWIAAGAVDIRTSGPYALTLSGSAFGVH
jgi:mono/diheme cytochrome c family protein